LNITKKQIYAEDYQQQFAEQLAGGAEAMQKAVSKWAGRDVGTDEMKAMMKDGKLIAKEILPLLAKEMAELARNGEALKNALKGLAVIESRMKTSFDNMLANIYQGGLSEGLKDLYTTLDDMFFLMSQGDSKVGKFLKGFIDGARESLIWVHDTLLDIYYLITEGLGVKGVNAEFLGKVTYWIAIAGAMNTVAGLMKIIFGGSMLSMIVKVSTAMGGLVALPFAIVAGLQELYDKLGWIQDPNAVAQQSGAIKQMTNQALVSGMPMFAQPYFQQQLSQAQNQVQTGQITLKLETTSDVDKLIQGHIENNNQKMIQSVVPMGWTSTSK
jgi:hypothetical protein